MRKGVNLYIWNEVYSCIYNFNHVTDTMFKDQLIQNHELDFSTQNLIFPTQVSQCVYGAVTIGIKRLGKEGGRAG